jgi:hypothetical protein
LAAFIFSQVALFLIILVPSSLPKPWRCQTQKGAKKMIMERGARPDALPREARRRSRDAILVVAVIIVFIVILASAHWH